MNALFNLFGSKKTEEPQAQEPKPILDENFVKNGEIVIAGVRFHKDITIREVCKTLEPVEPLSEDDQDNGFLLDAIELYGQVFNIDIEFEDGKLDQIIFRPIIGDRMPKEYNAYGSKEAVQFIKNLSREWLIKQLGKPHEDTDKKTRYAYDWGAISTRYSEPDLHGIRHGGDICIGYN